MRRKIVIRVAMRCEKCRSKAMSLVASTPGVDSVAVAGDGWDQLVVMGDGVDTVCLTSCLRKKVGPAGLLQVEEVTDGETETTGEATATASQEACTVAPWPQQYPYYWCPQPAAVYYPNPDPCSVL